MATATTVFHDPGINNVHVPAATNKLHVEFARAPESFSFNRYAQIVPGAAQSGYYPEIGVDDATRVVTLADFHWADGQERPDGVRYPHKWKKWTCVRRTFNFTLGRQTVDNATWDVVASHSRLAGMQAMTARSVDAATVMTTAANWPAANTSATLDALGTTSGTWFTSSTSQNFILDSFQRVTEKIMQATGGMVRSGDIMCVVTPDIAHGMSKTAEVRAYMTAHEQAMSVLRGDPALLSYGLPPVLYGIRMIVEDSVVNSTRRDEDGVTSTRGFQWDASSAAPAVFLSRPGGLENPSGGPTFSTLTMFAKEEMNVEVESDGFNRRVKGGVTEDYDIVLSAPASGYLIQDVTT